MAITDERSFDCGKGILMYNTTTKIFSSGLAQYTGYTITLNYVFYTNGWYYNS